MRHHAQRGRSGHIVAPGVGVVPVVVYPDPVLTRRDNAELDADGPMTGEVLRDLSDTLDASLGVALAAPQIGHAVRAIIVDVARDRRPERYVGHGRVLMLNPRIVETNEPYRVREGCLSVPEYTGNVTRFRHVVVEGDVPGAGFQKLRCEGFEALAFQHEVDHLSGTLFLDRVESPRRDLFRRKR